MSAANLVTGVSGLIGGAIAAELTARGDGVVAVVRDAGRRMPAVRAWVTALGGDGSLLRGISGDLDRPGLGLPDDTVASLGSVTRVFHAGARFSWDLSMVDARRTNRDGLLELVRLCDAMPSLTRFVLIGGYRATGPVWDDVPLRGRAPLEALLRYHGPYVASKVEGLHAFRRAAAARGLPFTVVHPGDVIGHSQTGVTNQLTGVGAIAQLTHARRLLARVGSPRAWVPLVTVDHVARFAVGAADHDSASGREYFVLDATTPTLHRLIEQICAHYGTSVPRLRLSARVAGWLPRWLTGVSRESLAFISEQRYPMAATDALESALGITHPPLGPAFARWLSYLASCEFDPGATDWRRQRSVLRRSSPGTFPRSPRHAPTCPAG